MSVWGCTPTWERWHGQGGRREFIAFESTDAIAMSSVPLEGWGHREPLGLAMYTQWWQARLCLITGNHGQNWALVWAQVCSSACF